MINWLWAQIKKLWAAVFKLGESADDNSLKILSTYDGIVSDTLNLITALKDLRHFDFDPKWSSRVINVPRAMDAVNELLDILLHGIHDRFQELHVAVTALVLSLKGRPPIQGHLPDPGGTLSKVVDYVGDLDVAWKAFGRAYHDATDFVVLLDDIKRRIETLDDFFLPQGNPKKTVDSHYRQRQRR